MENILAVCRNSFRSRKNGMFVDLNDIGRKSNLKPDLCILNAGASDIGTAKCPGPTELWITILGLGGLK